ncbi:MAG: DinB family protein [Candidatus Thorarchaeota archaeon]
MLHEFLRTALKRHLDETQPLIDQITDNDLMKPPFKDTKPLGEVILHMLRSIDFYLIGLAKNEWTPLPYSLEEYKTAERMKVLAREVFERARAYVDLLNDRELEKTITSFNRPAKAAEILLEAIEHSIHHRGQITVYFRLLGIEVPPIPYII